MVVVLHCVTVTQKSINPKSILIRQNEDRLINVKIKTFLSWHPDLSISSLLAARMSTDHLWPGTGIKDMLHVN